MSSRDPLQGMRDVEHLDPEAQQQVLDIANGVAGVRAERHPALRVAREHALQAASRVSAKLRHHTGAHHDFVEFEAVEGGKSVPAAARRILFAVLLGAALVDAYLAFNGVRYALGDLGQISYPWQDPLALASALMIGAVSLLTAKFGGEHLAWAERSTMHEPTRAKIRIPRHVRSLVTEDPATLERVLGEAPISVADDAFGDLDVIPPSPEVIAEQEHVAAEAAAEEEALAAHLFESPRSRRVHLAVAIALIGGQLSMWTVTGVLRAAYLARLTAANTTSVGKGGLLGSTAPVHSTGMGPVATGVLIVLASWFFYLLAVGVVFSMSSATQMRGEELERRMERANTALAAAIADAAEHLHEFERLRSSLAATEVAAANDGTLARLDREELDIGGLDLI
jgi:hypothetical protein